MLVGVEINITHDHFLLRDILPGIGLISEQFADNWYGTFRDWPNTVSPRGLHVGCMEGEGAAGMAERRGMHGGGLEANGSIPKQPCSTSLGSPLRVPTNNIWS